MSILIKGMEMPTNRPEHTYMMVFPSGEAWEVRYDDNRIMKYGTAIEIPMPHGRLIDADALKTKIQGPPEKVSVFEAWIDIQPTIIEAEREP